MQVSYRWLKNYVDCDLSAEEMAERLTMAGIAVEGVVAPVAGLDKIIVARITAVCPHPNSDHLKICSVDTGNGTREIVCGAPNVTADINAPLALPGVDLPTGLPVEAREFRGVLSEGVLCSGAELGTDQWGFGDEKGILILDQNLQPGTPLDIALGLDDKILEFELTPNRGDCQAVINIAREVQAITGGALHLPRITVSESGERTKDLIRVEIEEPELCRRYAARIVTNVKIGPSPAWMQYALRAAGIRPINNIVDVTNYVMVELGQPLHAFNYEMIHGRRIVVRHPRPGEKITSLDGEERALDEEMLVIADDREPVALAGVMGGLASEVTENTKYVLLESAYFDPLTIRRAARELNLRTEASQRFEKEVDIEGIPRALDRAVQLIEEMGGGQGTGGIVDEYVRPKAPLTIRLRTGRVNQVLGTSLERRQVQAIMDSLGFQNEVACNDALLVQVPSYRVDLEGEIDLIEEVARLYGYDKIEATVPEGILSQPLSQERPDRLRPLVVEQMVASGLDEVISYSFIGPSSFDKLGLSAGDRLRRACIIQNPLREEQSVLRTLLLPGLLDTLTLNYKRRQENLHFFELGKVFEPTGEGGQPDERLHLGIVATGSGNRGWQEQPVPYDFFYLKGILELLLDRLGIKEARYQPTGFSSFHPGRAAELVINGEVCGRFGELHPDVLERYEIPARVVAAELDMEKIRKSVNLNVRAGELPRYPAVERDLAVVVPAHIPAQRVTEVITGAGGELLQECRLFDIYQGKQVSAGCRSLAFSILYQSPHRTLTDEEVNQVHQRIVAALEQELGATLR